MARGQHKLYLSLEKLNYAILKICLLGLYEGDILISVINLIISNIVKILFKIQNTFFI